MEKLLSKEKVSKKIKDWKEEVLDLKVQLDNTMEKAQEAFEKQKENLRTWINNAEKEIQKMDGLSEEKAALIKGKLQEFRVQLALGKAETEDVLKEQQTKINQAIRELKIFITTTSEDSREKLEDFGEDAIQKLENFQTKFDLLRLQLNLGKKEAQLSWKETQKEVRDRLHELEIKLKKGTDVISEHWENFSDELSESWKDLRKVIKN